MKRSFLVLVATVIFCSSVPSLFAQPEQLQSCCSGVGDCGGAKCCDPESLNMLPCDPEELGYCMVTCVRPNGRN
jgi:hypothetical protein